MKPVHWFCPGAGCHAKSAVGTCFVPVAIAFLFVQFPFYDAVGFEFTSRRNGA